MMTQEELERLNERFGQIQKRDGLPCPDTGMTHCRDCHGAYAETLDEYRINSPYKPSCGHWTGCPEC